VSETLSTCNAIFEPSSPEGFEIIHKILFAVGAMIDAEPLEKPVDLILGLETEDRLQLTARNRVAAIGAQSRVFEHTPSQTGAVSWQVLSELVRNVDRYLHNESLHLRPAIASYPAEAMDMLLAPKRWKHFVAMALIGDGVMAAIHPKRDATAWAAGPAPWRALMQALHDRPNLTRAIAVAQIAGGVYWALRDEKGE
jgi:hypothetical protein